jgi:hypothetical protein
MKKQLLTLLAAGTVGSAFAQLPVSTAPQNKHIVLQEYTGIYCGYCPDGHTIANNIYNNNPGTVLINIHTGGYATVAAGEPDLTTSIGTAIATMPGMGISGYPAGDINRTILTGTAMATGRGSWTSMSNTIKNQPAYCNVAVEGTVDAATRVLTYTAQVYYTANSPASTNSLTVVLLEDDVFGPQHNYGNPYYNASNYNADGSYNHNHVLRKGLTAGNFGITIPVTTAGTTFTTTGTYTVPLTYGATGKTNPCMLGNINLAAFVTQTNSLTINGAKGPISIVNVPNAIDAGVSAIIADADVCVGNLRPFKFNLVNNGSSNLTSATINYSVTGGSVQSYNFTGNVAPFTQTVISLPAYSFPATLTNTLSVVVTNVNGAGADANAANDVITKSIPLTSKVANNLTIGMIFKSDQYGSESTWEILEEASNTVVASGGPYADLAASGTSVQPTVSFTANPGTCYKVMVYDSYGDGFNTGYGAGNYTIKSGTVTVYTMNGVMTDEDQRYFRTTTPTGINEASTSISAVSLFPNPTKNNTTLTIDLVQNETISISVMDVMGRAVYTENMHEAGAGNHVVQLNTENWANGVYNVNISSSSSTTSRKLVISK